MKKNNHLFLIIFLIIISCKNNDVKCATKSFGPLINDTLIVESDSSIIFLSPTNSEIKKLKKEKGDDSFYTIADDENSYRGNISEILDFIKYDSEITEKRFIKLGNQDIIDKNNISNKWSIIVYVKGKPLSIISSIDLYIKLSKLKANGAKINYNSLLDKIKLKNDDDIKKSLNNINGLWRIDCRNSLTILNISDSDIYMSLFSNTVYINTKLKSISNEPNSYLIYFFNQEDNYESDKNKIDVENISKEKPIGKLELKNNQLILYWYGLYNEKTKKIEFIDKDFVIIRENGGISPVVLHKCDE